MRRVLTKEELRNDPRLRTWNVGPVFVSDPTDPDSAVPVDHAVVDHAVVDRRTGEPLDGWDPDRDGPDNTDLGSDGPGLDPADLGARIATEATEGAENLEAFTDPASVAAGNGEELLDGLPRDHRHEPGMGVSHEHGTRDRDTEQDGDYWGGDPHPEDRWDDRF